MFVMDNNPQGTEGWLEIRAGKITSSRFGDLLSKSGKLIQTGKSYVMECVTEELSSFRKTFSSNAIEWGTLHEPEAIARYEAEEIRIVEDSGFWHDGLVGGSPDGLVGDDGIIEIKCPNTNTHLHYLMSSTAPDKYMPQMQGNMWVTGRHWCDFITYDPRVYDERMQIKVIRVERDDEYIEKIKTAVMLALKYREELLQKIGVEI